MNYYDELIRQHEILYNKMREKLINEQKQANGLYVIDGTSELIDGERIDDVTNLPLSKENYEDQLVLVHATHHFPNNHKVLCREDAGLKYQDKCFSHRTTVHTTINNMVEAHGYGNWDNCKYIVIEPFNTQKEKPMGFSRDDTYFSRNLNLTSKGLILVNENAYNQLSEEQISNNNIILYKGNGSIATTKALIMMGYKPQNLNNSRGKNNAYVQNENFFIEYRNKMCYDPGKHMQTLYQELEFNNLNRDEFLSEQRKTFIDTRKGNFLMTPEEVYKYYENILAPQSEDNKISFPAFLITNGILPDQNDNYYALTSENSISVSKKYHNSIDRNDINNEKLETDFKDKYKKLLETVKKNEEDKIMNEILQKNPEDFTDKEIHYANKMIDTILKSNSNELYSFIQFTNHDKRQIQIYDTNCNDEQLYNSFNKSNMENYEILFDAFLVRKENYYDKKTPFYQTIKNLNSQVKLSKEDFDQLYRMQLVEKNNKSYGISTINGLILILLVSVSLINILLMIVKQ